LHCGYTRFGQVELIDDVKTWRERYEQPNKRKRIKTFSKSVYTKFKSIGPKIKYFIEEYDIYIRTIIMLVVAATASFLMAIAI